MTLKTIIAKMMSHFTPLALIKHINPSQMVAPVFTHTNHDPKPWINADTIELTQEDFA
jgi:hypothetical protein